MEPRESGVCRLVFEDRGFVQQPCGAGALKGCNEAKLGELVPARNLSMEAAMQRNLGPSYLSIDTLLRPSVQCWVAVKEVNLRFHTK